MPEPLQRGSAATGITGRKIPGKPPERSSPGARQQPALWYALQFPVLREVPDPDTLKQLASTMQAFSDHISLSPPDALLFEIRGSLRHFGGLEALIHAVNEQLDSLLPMTSQAGQAITPAPSASLLLARSSQSQQNITRVTAREGLRSALGPLPVGALPLDHGSIRRLHNSGLLHLRDIWRLPATALRQRLGPKVTDYLQRCLAEKPEPLPRWQADPHFHSRRETDWPLEKQTQLLNMLEEMLGDFSEYLKCHHVHTRHLQIALEHESREESSFELQLRRATRDRGTLLMLLETRLEQFILPAPVTAIALEAGHFESLQAAGQARQEPSSWKKGSLLLDTLQARLGREAIQELGCSQEHLPELACGKREAGKKGTDPFFQEKGVCPLFSLPYQRPTWLMETPKLLGIRDGMPFHSSPLKLLSGPERIETGWWRGTDIRRDYYVACNEEGQRFWIFRCPDDRSPRWFLHGLFS